MMPGMGVIIERYGGPKPGIADAHRYVFTDTLFLMTALAIVFIDRHAPLNRFSIRFGAGFSERRCAKIDYEQRGNQE